MQCLQRQNYGQHQVQQCYLKTVHCTKSRVHRPLRSTNAVKTDVSKIQRSRPVWFVTCSTLNVALAVLPSSASLANPVFFFASSLPWPSPFSLKNFLTSISSTTFYRWQWMSNENVLRFVTCAFDQRVLITHLTLESCQMLLRQLLKLPCRQERSRRRSFSIGSTSHCCWFCCYCCCWCRREWWWCGHRRGYLLEGLNLQSTLNFLDRII